MTLQQLRYVTMVAKTGTITEAANKLYISQPSLTSAIHELENEMNIVIFRRTNKGVSVTKEGEDFLGYARQVLEQAAILEDKYKKNSGGKKQFCVSTQHYSFAVNAFVDLIKKYGQDEYDFFHKFFSGTEPERAGRIPGAQKSSLPLQNRKRTSHRTFS